MRCMQIPLYCTAFMRQDLTVPALSRYYQYEVCKPAC